MVLHQPYPDEHSPRAFDAAKHVLCCLHKDSDIPEVQAVIALVLPSLDAYWKRIVEEAVGEIDAQLDAFADELATPSIDAIALAPERERDRLLEDLILALLLALERRARQPISPAGTQLLRRAGETLMQDGAKDMGETLDFTRAPRLPQAAVEDMLALIRGRIELRRDEITTLLRTFLTQRSARTSLGQLAAAAGAPSRETWRAALLNELGANTSTWLPFTVDQWAYRWYNIGGFTAARQGGVIALQAVATIDLKTSKFCRWVNGRVISMERAQRQINAHVQAALQGDVRAMIENWPLLRLRGDETNAELAIQFTRVGLPPYHGRCRTRVRKIQLR